MHHVHTQGDLPAPVCSVQLVLFCNTSVTGHCYARCYLWYDCDKINMMWYGLHILQVIHLD